MMAFMQIVSIENPSDNRYPFTQETFEDRTIVYHGSWSTYCARVESDGLLSGNAALDLMLKFVT